jgi:S-adenosylmethionine hydrolase
VLLTDFGADDYRAPRLKGYIYSANPQAVIIDGTHGISALDIAGGAYVLDVTAEKFPVGTVFVAIVGTTAHPGT